MGFGEGAAAGVEADVPLTPPVGAIPAEPGAGFCVVEIGPAAVPEVSDVLALWAAAFATVVDGALLLVAAEAELALPLQAVATRAKETRRDRYIFPTCC